MKSLTRRGQRCEVERGKAGLQHPSFLAVHQKAKKSATHQERRIYPEFTVIWISPSPKERNAKKKKSPGSGNHKRVQGDGTWKCRVPISAPKC
ncbi:hypothetical protein AVEN_89673-1 [Araneus ventricosus]|uniref:Uncharacterized protein n=1 Tax=Araneus ventricosus TaxID=182803 RepID=A0A4Y2N7D3_ARAVE|nr:hypothetical protein AVEN_89673-1 [Araneus ventricosus]